jgi:RecA/RadA recombinase
LPPFIRGLYRKLNMAKTVAEKEAELTAKKNAKKKEIKRFPTGIAEFDAILSEGRDSKEMGYPEGMVIGVHSQSKGGKTRLALEAIFASLLYYGKENVDYLYLDAEAGMSIDTEACYGFPLEEGKHLKKVKTVEQMQVLVSNFMNNKSPKKQGVVVIDSLDALSIVENLERLEERKKMHKKDEEGIKEIKSYGAKKAKLLNEIMPIMASEANTSNTLVFYIHHQKQKINAMPFENPNYISGGTATGYYPSVMQKIRRATTFGAKDREVGYLLEILFEKSRTKYERRKTYIAIDHLMGFDVIKSNLISLYDLITEKNQFDEPKSTALKWQEVWNPLNACEPVEAVTDAEVKQFVVDNELTEPIREEYGRMIVGNMKKYINGHKEVKDKFIAEFGVMDLETLCAYIEDNELEDELYSRTLDKFFTIEESLRPVKRKSRRL